MRKVIKHTEQQKKWAQELGAVTTVTEAAQMYKVAPTTIKSWILEDKIMAVRSGGVWLLSLGSLADFAGLPEYITEEELNSTRLLIPQDVIIN